MTVGDACSYCGCTYLFSARQYGGAAAAPSRCEAGSQSESWVISFKCPGCGLVGAHFSERYSQSDAQALVRAQSRLTKRAAAKDWADDWRREVRRRAETEAGLFTGLVRRRLPQVTPHLKPIPPASEVDGAAPDDPDWDCALRLTIPSENPAVDIPLEALVKCREVRVQWVDHWHHHLEAGLSTAPTDYGHLERAIALLEAVLAEELLAVVCYRQGEIVSGGDSPRGGEPRRPWEMMDPAHPACADSMVVRSWRGSYDRVITRSDEAPASQETGAAS